MKDLHTLTQPEEVAFTEIVQAALAVVQSAQSSTALPVELDLEEDLPTIMLERAPMTHLLAGLLARALSVTAPGNVTLEARCLHGRGGIGQGDWLWVSLRGAVYDFSATVADFPRALSWAECQAVVTRHRGRIWIAGTANPSTTSGPSAMSSVSAVVFMIPVWTP